MALNLDTRQRAILEAMGITVWLPEPVTAVAVETLQAPEALPHAPAPQRPSAPAAAPTQHTPAERAPHAAQQPVEAASAPAATMPAPALPRQSAESTKNIATHAEPSGSGERQTSSPAMATLGRGQSYVQQPMAGPGGAPGQGWRLGPAQAVFPQAEAAASQTPGTGGWLILLEPPANTLLLTPAQKPTPGSAQTALQGDAARLLDNMLRALGLQQQPRVFSAALHRLPADAEAATNTADDQAPPALADALQALVQTLQPACILVLGLASARAVLGRHDALGRLRSESHHIAGVPTVVTYDPNYLLRAPQAKAGAWADLCRAHSWVTKHYMPPDSAAQ